MTTVVEQSDEQPKGRPVSSVGKRMSLIPEDHGLSPVAAKVHFLVPFRELHFTYLAKVVRTVS